MHIWEWLFGWFVPSDGAPTPITQPGALEYKIVRTQPEYKVNDRQPHYRVNDRHHHYKVEE